MINLNDLLIVKNAELYAHIFENRLIGLSRSLFYELRVDFEQFEVDGFELDCNLQGGWLKNDTRNWRDLELNLGYAEQPEAEWTFYTTSHDWIDDLNGQLHTKGSQCIVDLDFSITINHVLDESLEVNKKISSVIEYEGLILSPQNLGIESDDIFAIKELAAQFVNLAEYDEPVLKYNNYLFKPKYY